MTVKATMWDGERSVPGALLFYGFPGPGFTDRGPKGFDYICPCGCGTFGTVRIAEKDKTPRSPTHGWDGNKEAPTVIGMITHMVAGAVCWQGILVKGVWHEDPGGTARDPGEPPGDSGSEGI